MEKLLIGVELGLQLRSNLRQHLRPCKPALLTRRGQVHLHRHGLVAAQAINDADLWVGSLSRIHACRKGGVNALTYDDAGSRGKNKWDEARLYLGVWVYEQQVDWGGVRRVRVRDAMDRHLDA